MTIAICLKVGDGVVLGTDSATSLVGDDGAFRNLYLSAEKCVNLIKGLPLGMMTFGLGSLAGLSICSLVRNLREELTGGAREWRVRENNYTVEEVARKVCRYFTTLYRAEYPASAQQTRSHPPPALGLVISGFSSGDHYSQVWSIVIDGSDFEPAPVLEFDRRISGVVRAWGEPEAINRLLFGWSWEAYFRLKESGLDSDTAEDVLISHAPLAHTGMPLQDAIDLVDYLALVTTGFKRFREGYQTVAPPIDLAAITRHQGFRWVRRKHYYSMALNPPYHGEWCP